MLRLKLKGGALYVAVIISILISIVLSLFIVLAYYNINSVQSQNSLNQLKYSLDSGFEIAESKFYNSGQSNTWQKMPYNNDSAKIKKLTWGCFTLINVNVKNAHFKLQKTGLFGSNDYKDTAIMVTEQNNPIGLAGSIKFNGYCYFPKAGIKSAYIEGSSFSDLNSVRPYILSAPSNLPEIEENYLKSIEDIQQSLNTNTDSLISFIPDVLNQSFENNTAVIQQSNVFISSQHFSNNIKIIASDLITVDNNCQLNNILLVARKVIFKKGFKGTVHVIAKDSIVAEDACEFDYPSSFCVYSNVKQTTPLQFVRGIFFGNDCQFKGGLLAVNNKTQSSRMFIKLNKQFVMIGDVYSSNFADIQGKIYGSVFCQKTLLQTPSGVYENHLFNCLVDPKTYYENLTVPNWFGIKTQKQKCAQWF